MKIYLLGFMGVGKTYWGKQLSDYLNLPWKDLDEEIVEKEGMDIPAIFDQYGESHFRKLERKYLEDLSQMKSLILSSGGGTPCYSGNMGYMNRQGTTVWLNSSVEVILERIRKEQELRPLLKDLKEKELKKYITDKLRERTPFYKQAKITIDPEEYELSSFLKKIKKCIEDS